MQALPRHIHRHVVNVKMYTVLSTVSNDFDRGHRATANSCRNAFIDSITLLLNLVVESINDRRLTFAIAASIYTL